MKTQTKTQTKTSKATVAVVTPAPKAKLDTVVSKAKAKKIAPAPVAISAPAPAPAPVAISAPVAAAEVSRRVTPGAAINEWRVVKSQRQSKSGWFLQGGSYAEADGRNRFTVGFEAHYADRGEAYAALAAQKQLHEVA